MRIFEVRLPAPSTSVCSVGEVSAGADRSLGPIAMSADSKGAGGVVDPMRHGCGGCAPVSRRRRDRGTSFVEVLVAIVLLGTAVGGTLTALRTTIVSSQRDEDQTNAHTWLLAVEDALYRAPYYSCADAGPGVDGLPEGWTRATSGLRIRGGDQRRATTSRMGLSNRADLRPRLLAQVQRHTDLGSGLLDRSIGTTIGPAGHPVHPESERCCRKDDPGGQGWGLSPATSETAGSPSWR